MSGRVAVVEDERAIRDGIVDALRAEGLEAEPFGNGDHLLGALGRGFDAVVLDLALPGTSGVELVRQVRSRSSVPVLVVSGRDGEADRVLAIETGADDYLTKPFSLTELVTRVRAAMRRRELDRADAAFPVTELGRLRIDHARHEVSVDGDPVRLTRSEFKLLTLLAERPGQVLSRTQIMERLWEGPYVGDAHACEVHVSNLRRKLERTHGLPRRIVTVRGVGYKLAPG